MEALYPQTWEKDRAAVVRKEDEEEGGGGRETTDEETDDDSEPETPPVVRRKVSFADAFGLNLVSVKEFDNVGLAEPEEDVRPPEVELIHPLEEFYMSCLFTVPSTPEELDKRLEGQQVELENIELLPGTTTLRGTIRVVNLCYSKFVYVLITLDGWKSHFDLLAEYIPGSSDRKTDRFAFKYSLVPPFEREGTRVEFCLRYETSEGTFWANNKDQNYVLFCHQRAHAKEARVNEQEPQWQRESPNCNWKRSCLKANRRGSAEEKNDKMTAIATDIPEDSATDKAERANRKTKDSAEIHSISHHEDQKPLVDSIRNRSRATRLARVQDYLSQRKQEELKAHTEDSTNGLSDPRPQKPYPHHQSLPNLWGSTSRLFRIRHKKRVEESPQILTYHQIPLLTLDWSNDKTQHSGTADVKSSEDTMDNAPSVSELWEAFLNGTDESMDDKTSVCDIWQAFLNGPDCKDHSGVPESEWLQTAASVSPSNHETEPRTRCAITKGRRTFQTDTALAEWQPPASRDHVTLLAETTLNTEEQRPADVQKASPRDDNAGVCDESKRSKGSCITDTLQECGAFGAEHVSEGSVNSWTRWCEHAAPGRARKGEGEEPFTTHTAESVTSFEETGTAEMTATPESQNASAVDRISQGVRTDKGFFYRREGEVTGTAHNTADDTLAFRETIRQETEDGEGDVLFTSGQGEEERVTLNYTDKEILRPQQSEETRISQRYTDEKECEEFRFSRNSEDTLRRDTTDKDEVRLEQSRAYAFELNQTHEEPEHRREISTDGINTSVQTQSVESIENGEALRPDHDDDEFRPIEINDGCAFEPSPIVMAELRWNETRNVRSQKDVRDVDGAINPREDAVTETVLAFKFQCPDEVLEAVGEDVSQRDQERVNIGKLEVMEELMEDAGSTQEGRKNLSTELKDATVGKVESSRQAELKKLPVRTKDPITVDDIRALKSEIELGVKEAFTVSADPHLDEGILEQMLDLKDDVSACERGSDSVGVEMGYRLSDIPDLIHDVYLKEADDLSEEGLSEAFDSGVFSLTELLTNPNSTSTLNEGLGPNFAITSDEHSMTSSSLSLTQTLSSPVTSSCFAPVEAGGTESQVPPSLTQNSPALAEDHDSFRQNKERSVTHQVICSQSEDCAVSQQESFSQLSPPAYQQSCSSSSENLDKSSTSVFVWWTVFFSLGHVTRTRAYALLAVVFFVTIFLCDFPACFALYVFAVCWWGYQWKKHQVTVTKGIVCRQ